LADDALLDADVDQRTLTRDALAVEDVELGLLEGRRALVLHDLHAGPVADDLRTVLEALDTAYVQSDRGGELQRPATGGGLRTAEEDTHLLPELVDEDRRRVRVVEGTGDLAEGLAHQASLQTDVAVAHLALDLGPGHQGRHRVDDDDVQRP